VLIVPADVSSAKAVDEPEFSVHHATPVVRPADAELDRLAAALNSGGRIAIYGGSGASRRTMPSSRWRTAARAGGADLACQGLSRARQPFRCRHDRHLRQ
jgi:thiamine pyrophosphate-dependent acetolactate synthase large subunit-like protein